jgi:signal transduction histidine kinase
MTHSEKDFLQLQREYRYVSTVQILLEKIFSTTELREVMEAVADALQVLAPGCSFAYVIADQTSLKFSNLVYLFSPRGTQAYIRELPKSFHAYATSLPDDLSGKAELVKQLEGQMYIEFVRGVFDHQTSDGPIQVVTAPLDIQSEEGEQVLGLFQVAWFDESHALDDTMKHHVKDIANLTAHSIEKIQMIQNLEEEKLQETIKAKSEFLSFAAHQLRTPLGSMRWNMEALLARGTEMSPEVKEVLTANYDSIKRLVELVNHLLNLARTGTGSSKANLETTDVNEIVLDVLKQEKQRIEQRKITLTYELKEQNLPPVVVDKKSFRECVQNLVSNATKYNKEAGQLNVVVDRADQHVRISVQDTGRGIPEKDQGQVFTKFYRAENASDDNTDGTGLGLFMVKSYVEAWKGKIWFESKQNQGSTFHIELPLQTQPVSQQPQ